MTAGTGPSIVDAMLDPALFGRWFSSLEWKPWRIALSALFGLPLDADDAAFVCAHTGLSRPPTIAAKEGWIIAGRRAGKSRIAALVAVFLGLFRDYRPILAPGERATIMVIAADRRQARTVMRYIGGLLDAPILKRSVQSRTADAIHLTNRVTVEVHTASFRSVRGYTVAAAIADEVAFWRTEDAANPDVEILNGLRPGMATVPGSLLLALSSPYARRGALWDTYRRHYGRDGHVLVWQAPTVAMNPTIDERVIADAYEADDIAARSEYGGQFRSDLEDFVSRETLDVVVVKDRHELPPMRGRRYVAFCDPSGGSSDSMTLAVAHVERERVILDLVREVRPPFSPDAVVEDFSATLGAYGVRTVTGDHYGGEWPRERFRKHGVGYVLAEKTKSQLYLDLLPLLTASSVELLDNRTAMSQLLGLERRTAWGGRDSVDHPRGARDDVANAVAGAVALAWATRRSGRTKPLISGTATVVNVEAEMAITIRSAFMQQLRARRF